MIVSTLHRISRLSARYHRTAFVDGRNPLDSAFVKSAFDNWIHRHFGHASPNCNGNGKTRLALGQFILDGIVKHHFHCESSHTSVRKSRLETGPAHYGPKHRVRTTDVFWLTARLSLSL